jgi:hypothetical protein
MMNMRSEMTKGGDEENTDFGLPAKTVDQKSGFDRGVEQQVETDDNPRLRPSEEKDIPQESLAARIAKIQKGG